MDVDHTVVKHFSQRFRIQARIGPGMAKKPVFDRISEQNFDRIFGQNFSIFATQGTLGAENQKCLRRRGKIVGQLLGFGLRGLSGGVVRFLCCPHAGSFWAAKVGQFLLHGFLLKGPGCNSLSLAVSWALLLWLDLRTQRGRSQLVRGAGVPGLSTGGAGIAGAGATVGLVECCTNC